VSESSGGTTGPTSGVSVATPAAVPDAASGVDVVRLQLPAVGAYLSVLRSVTAGLAARLNFTLDEIEDLRIAVDEACALLLPSASPGALLDCAFQLSHEALQVSVSVDTVDGELPDRDSFAWTVLSALVGEVDSHSAGSQVGIDLIKHRTVVTA
jgi:serine/threonine-protein kinase RsbW